MQIIRRRSVVLLTFFLFSCWSEAGFAAEKRGTEVLKDPMDGCSAGELVGAAVMAFAKKAVSHLDYTAHDNADGVLAGTANTPAKSPKPLAELENGKVTLGVPTITPDFKQTNSKGQTSVTVMAELISGKF